MFAQAIVASSILLVALFGAMVVVSVLASAGKIRLPRRTANGLLVAGPLLMLSTALI